MFNEKIFFRNANIIFDDTIIEINIPCEKNSTNKIQVTCKKKGNGSLKLIVGLISLKVFEQ